MPHGSPIVPDPSKLPSAEATSGAIRYAMTQASKAGHPDLTMLENPAAVRPQNPRCGADAQRGAQLSEQS